MKAVFFDGPNKIGYRETPTPECPENGVLIKVISVGLCGSDIRTFASGHAGVEPPFIIGHEVVGEIAETKTDYYTVGQKVILNPEITCGECSYCKAGLDNHCKNLKFVGTDIPGGYAQYIPVPSYGANPRFCHVLPDDVDMDAFPIAETYGSVYATHNYLNIEKGDTVLVIGAGPLGNLHAANAKIRGAKKVILSEVNQPRLDKAKQFNAVDVFVNPTRENLAEIIDRETNGDGVDVAITACPVGSAQEEATHYLRPRGKLLLFGGLPPNNCRVAFDSNLIHYKELKLVGGYSYSPEAFKEAVDLILEGKLNAKQYVTHVIPLKDIERGIEMTKTGEAIKVVLKPWEE